MAEKQDPIKEENSQEVHQFFDDWALYLDRN